jgi:hypothetical protein
MYLAGVCWSLGFGGDSCISDCLSHRITRVFQESKDEVAMQSFREKLQQMGPFDRRRQWLPPDPRAQTLTLSQLDFIRIEDVSFDYTRQEE